MPRLETAEEKILSAIDDDIAEIYRERDCGTYDLSIPLKIHIARHLAIISKCLQEDKVISGKRCDLSNLDGNYQMETISDE